MFESKENLHFGPTPSKGSAFYAHWKLCINMCARPAAMTASGLCQSYVHFDKTVRCRFIKEKEGCWGKGREEEPGEVGSGWRTPRQQWLDSMWKATALSSSIGHQSPPVSCPVPLGRSGLQCHSPGACPPPTCSGPSCTL